ncbi:hypothetical protein Glove_1033g7 [Diversispora epigaea]|uniref:BACK domain-containing protein n=1 Tax=Diversispora epigaea TaxID=1348612 RepID=A0A397FXZ6_9GLOM|nr:hypothetical protein Glove_1033g7 [Diversispora epigaea]
MTYFRRVRDIQPNEYHIKTIIKSSVSAQIFDVIFKKFCNDIIEKHPSLIFDISDFTSLPESALLSLLKRNDLQMEEVKILDGVIKWGNYLKSYSPY